MEMAIACTVHAQSYFAAVFDRKIPGAQSPDPCALRTYGAKSFPDAPSVLRLGIKYTWCNLLDPPL